MGERSTGFRDGVSLVERARPSHGGKYEPGVACTIRTSAAHVLLCSVILLLSWLPRAPRARGRETERVRVLRARVREKGGASDRRGLERRGASGPEPRGASERGEIDGEERERRGH